MTHKRVHRAEVRGCGSGGQSRPGVADLVTMYLEVTGDRDPGRPIQANMTPEEARHWAELLCNMADAIDARTKPEGE